MRHMGKYILLVGVTTTLMLLFVHQQLSIMRFSYRINSKEEQLSELLEAHKNLKFKVASLKSPMTVEDKLTAADITLVLPSEVRLVKVPTPSGMPLRVAASTISTVENSMFKMLGFEKEAQAELSH